MYDLETFGVREKQQEWLSPTRRRVRAAPIKPAANTQPEPAANPQSEPAADTQPKPAADTEPEPAADAEPEPAADGKLQTPQLPSPIAI